jgi:hypothetical protein
MEINRACGFPCRLLELHRLEGQVLISRALISTT